MTSVAATSNVAKVASADAVSTFRVIGQEGMMGRFMDRAIPADPRPRPVFVLAHCLPFAAISQNVAKGDEQQECNQRSDDQQDFQGSLLKSGSYQNV